MQPRRTRSLAVITGALALATALVASTAAMPAANAARVPISGAGSTWSANAIDQWRKNVAQYGIKVEYAQTGSSDGRNQFRNGTVDFAVSEIPYGLRDGNVIDQPPTAKDRAFAYMPIVAGGTSIMYNLTIGSKQVTNLRLSGATLTGIFTNNIKSWNDPAIKKDNPGLNLPARRIVPVYRSDGSGTTAQFTAWMAAKHAGPWNAYCKRAGRSSNPCGQTSTFPAVNGSGFVGQSGSLGVSGYVAQKQNVGTITYVEYSYALNTGYPVAKLLNSAGYYVEPTPQNTAVGLLKAKIKSNLTADLAGVYGNSDRRAYPLSSYSYMIIPTARQSGINDNKGGTLAEFAYYFLCEGQQQAPLLGYSPLPINLVQAGLTQVRRIPGVKAQSINIKKCNNPTFSSDGSNTLAKTAPYPPSCDKQGPTQCATGTGGAKNKSTSVNNNQSAGNNGGGGTASNVPGATATAPGTVPGEVPGAANNSAVVGAEGGAAVDPVALSLASDGGIGVKDAAMALAGVLLLLVVFAPPLLARRLAGRREQ